MPPVWHWPQRADGAAAAGEPERADGLAQAAMQAVLVDDAVAAAGVDEVAVGRPARAHAPGRHVARGHDARNGLLLPPVPDAQRAVDGGVEECALGEVGQGCRGRDCGRGASAVCVGVGVRGGGGKLGCVGAGLVGGCGVVCCAGGGVGGGVPGGRWEGGVGAVGGFSLGFARNGAGELVVVVFAKVDAAGGTGHVVAE